jgi:hypothetical protein
MYYVVAVGRTIHDLEADLAGPFASYKAAWAALESMGRCRATIVRR